MLVFMKLYIPWFIILSEKTSFNVETSFLTFSRRFTLWTRQKVKVKIVLKELSLCNKLWFSNTYIFSTGWCKPLIFQTYIFSSNRIHCFKYLRSTALGYKDIEIRKSDVCDKDSIPLWLDFANQDSSLVLILMLFFSKTPNNRINN